MAIKSWLKFCPPKQQPADTCPADLAKCNSDKAALQAQLSQVDTELSDTKAALTEITANLQACNTDLGKAQLAYALLTKGPAAPTKDSLRLLSGVNMQQLLAVKLGQPFIDCLGRNQVHFAWPPWLICRQSDISSYLDFYNTYILPLIQPYTVLDWVDTKGNKVQVSGRTCSDFSALFWGLPTMYLGWTPLAWGVMWAYVESLFLTGGHAFDFVVCWDPPYTEDSIDGLSP